MNYTTPEVKYVNKWHHRFLELANTVAQWSKDPSTKVGAVITLNKRIVSLGFNGFPAGTDDSEEIYQDRDRKLRRTIHAERNALLFAQRDLTECTIYVTHPPCSQCAGDIIQSEIKTVVYAKPEGEFKVRWLDDCVEALKMFREAGVEVIEL
jgi:dCMP deaminase